MTNPTEDGACQLMTVGLTQIWDIRPQGEGGRWGKKPALERTSPRGTIDPDDEVGS